MDDVYTLDLLLERLNDIKDNGEGDLNFPSAIYCLALEIKKLHNIERDRWKARWLDTNTKR